MFTFIENWRIRRLIRKYTSKVKEDSKTYLFYGKDHPEYIWKVGEYKIVVFCHIRGCLWEFRKGDNQLIGWVEGVFGAEDFITKLSYKELKEIFKNR